ncbi:hypothetical protein [Massilia eburnea]|uniref:hypothetical protein n=1 Tax=Massilia eburnea TaxID=1776165 RepID=UPI003D6A912D
MSSWRPSPGYLAAALLLAVGAASLVFFLWYFARDDAAAGAGQTPAPANVAAAGRPASAATAASAGAREARPGPIPAALEGDADPTRDLRSYVMRGENPTMNEVIKRLHQQGVHTYRPGCVQSAGHQSADGGGWRCRKIMRCRLATCATTRLPTMARLLSPS